MNDLEMKTNLDQTKPNKTFDELVLEKMKRKEMTKDEAIADILATAMKTNKHINDILL